MKNKLLPIFLCSLLYLVGCSTKQDPVKQNPIKPKNEEVQTSARRRPGSSPNGGAMSSYSTGTGHKFTGANFFAVDIGVGPRANYDRVWTVTNDGRVFLYSWTTTSPYWNTSSGWKQYYLTLNGQPSTALNTCNTRTPSIDVDNAGMPWFVDCRGTVWRTAFDLNRNDVLQLISTGMNGALDVGCGSNGNVYITKLPESSSTIYQYNWQTLTWSFVNGMTGARISVDQLGRPWVVQENGPLYYLDNGSWQLAGQGGWRDVGAARYEWPCTLGAGRSQNIFMYDYWQNAWSQPYGTGYQSRVDTDPEGYAYFTNFAGEIWTWF